MLELTDICKAFEKNTVNEKVALDQVSLSLNSGEFVTLVGSNGAGKSTLLNAVAVVYLPDCGRIMLDEREITHLSEHQRAAWIGRVFQNPLTGTAPLMTVEENLVMAWRRGQRRRLRKAIRFQERSFFREQLATLGLGLEDRLTTKVGLLSGGQRQALTLLMATLRKPQLLLLDEHIASLDPRTAEIVMDLTCRIVNEQQLTAIMITHNLEQALDAGTRTVMMHEGRIVLDIRGLERKRMNVLDLMNLFEKNSGANLNSDRVLLQTGSGLSN
jgi:putative ABC transport system ATP-binding protein